VYWPFVNHKYKRGRTNRYQQNYPLRRFLSVDPDASDEVQRGGTFQELLVHKEIR